MLAPLTLSEGAPAAFLTDDKARLILDRDKAQITGFTLTLPSGSMAIVDKSAVRWLEKPEFWELMHPEGSPNERMREENRKLRQALQAVINHASEPERAKYASMVPLAPIRAMLESEESHA